MAKNIPGRTDARPSPHEPRGAHADGPALAGEAAGAVVPRHIFFHPDCGAATGEPVATRTVGPGFSPGLLTLAPRRRKALAGSPLARHTAGGEFHPALKTCAGLAGR